MRPLKNKDLRPPGHLVSKIQENHLNSFWAVDGTENAVGIYNDEP